MRIVLLLILLAVAGVARADDPQGSFTQFCDEWAGKLAERERDNLTHIQWEPTGSGVKGAYVGYTQDHTCVTKIGTQDTPVGKITYREIRYEKLGVTIEEAERNPARPVETTEITEIFRYAGGKWIY